MFLIRSIRCHIKSPVNIKCLTAGLRKGVGESGKRNGQRNGTEMCDFCIVFAKQFDNRNMWP